jgi:hypothetical protein
MCRSNTVLARDEAMFLNEYHIRSNYHYFVVLSDFRSYLLIPKSTTGFSISEHKRDGFNFSHGFDVED